MKLDELLNTPPPATPEIESAVAIDEEVEKLAEYLEAFAEEDTLLDELARAAVLADIVERHNGN